MLTAGRCLPRSSPMATSEVKEYADRIVRVLAEAERQQRNAGAISTADHLRFAITIVIREPMDSPPLEPEGE